MKKCEYCGAEIDEEFDERCPNCGAPVPASVEEEPPKEPEIPVHAPVVETPAAPASTAKPKENNSSLTKSALKITALMVFLIVVMGAVVGALTSDDDKTQDLDGAKATYEQFMDAFDKAVNNGNISEIAPYVAKDSSAYKYIKNLAAGRHSTVSYQSWRYFGWDIEYNSQDGMIEIKSEEKYYFQYKAGGDGFKDFFVTYYIVPQSPYRIIRITQRKDPYTDWQPGVITGGSVNIRTSAEMRDNNVITQGKLGDFIKVYPSETKSADGVTWLRIRHEKSGLGWISSEYAEYDPVCTQ